MSNPDVTGPIRTCVGCRVRESVSAMLRVVAVSGVVIPDLRRRYPGRGAWVHPSQGCVDNADRRRAFARALRLAEPPDVSRIWALVNDVREVTFAEDTVRDTGPGTEPQHRGRALNARKQVEQQ